MVDADIDLLLPRVIVEAFLLFWKLKGKKNRRGNSCEDMSSPGNVVMPNQDIDLYEF